MKVPATIFTLLAVTASTLLAEIRVGSNSPEWLALAAQDLSSDIQKTTSQSIPVTRGDPGGEIIIGSLEDSVFNNWVQKISASAIQSLEGKDEAFEILSHQNSLVFVGSDPRGAMRAIYTFSKEILGIDPTYLWTGIEPIKRADLDWSQTRLSGSEPSFRFRGWFINDEDLLQGWIESGGRRYIDYPHYKYAVDPKAMAAVCETAVRLGYNLIIPASFLDIDNAPERALADEAKKRGLYLSMHHIEPLGVSAFTFFNYWKRRGEEHLFSYFSSKKQMEETWRYYAQLWAEYPNVVWQLGLRGIADRPMWMADPNTPETDEERGAIMTEAIALQRRIVDEVSKDSNPVMTTTLWAEGAVFFKEGFMRIPEDVMIIFADNSPGRVWQSDFHEMPRDPRRNYGVYFHHQLWGTGPHMVQGVSANEQGYLFNQAYHRDARDYAILNASSIREFVFGLSASAASLTDTEAFDAYQFTRDLCAFWFGDAADAAVKAYESFFESYLENERGVPYFIDGLTRQRGYRNMGAIRAILENGRLPEEENSAKNSWVNRHLADMRPPLPGPGDAVGMLETQIGHLDVSYKLMQEALQEIEAHCDASRARFFKENLIAQSRILRGLHAWALELERAVAALADGDRNAAIRHVEQSLNEWKTLEQGQAMITANPRWKHWYRGDTKMNLKQVKQSTEDVLAELKN